MLELVVEQVVRAELVGELLDELLDVLDLHFDGGVGLKASSFLNRDDGFGVG